MQKRHNLQVSITGRPVHRLCSRIALGAVSIHARHELWSSIHMVHHVRAGIELVQELHKFMSTIPNSVVEHCSWIPTAEFRV